MFHRWFTKLAWYALIEKVEAMRDERDREIRRLCDDLCERNGWPRDGEC